MAFAIPKFMAIIIPMLVDAAASGFAVRWQWRALVVAPAECIHSLFAVHLVDYLGFWLCAVFALLVAGPLYGDTLSAKVAGSFLRICPVVPRLSADAAHWWNRVHRHRELLYWYYGAVTGASGRERVVFKNLNPLQTNKWQLSAKQNMMRWRCRIEGRQKSLFLATLLVV